MNITLEGFIYGLEFKTRPGIIISHCKYKIVIILFIKEYNGE